MPVKTNSAMNPMKNSTNDFCNDAASTQDVHTVMAMKFQNVVLAPPILSASQPPTGRISDPTSGPRKVRYATFTGSTTCLPFTKPEAQKCDGNWFCSTWPKAKPNPMKEPNVPM